MRSISVKVDEDVALAIDAWRKAGENPSFWLRKVLHRAVRRRQKARSATEAR